MSIKCEKPKLKTWLVLQQINSDILDAVETKDLEKLSDKITSYVSSASFVDTDFWFDVAQAYTEITLLCIPKMQYPVLQQEDKEIISESWDYKGRNWYAWLHTFARRYGWTIEYVANMEFDDAIALMQEILVEEQIQKEWEWSLTEIAYPYNESTKKSEFHPLDRPKWMIENTAEKSKPIQAPKIERFDARMLPIGVVVKI